jgi:outer membrane protein OmpA-like peptidoglycan-associated protein
MLLSSVRRSVAFGQAQDVRIGFILDHEGVATPERVTLSIDGERAAGWHATLDRKNLTLGAGEQRIVATIHVPGSATATRHLYTLAATGEAGHQAQAAVEFDVDEALAKELEQGGRARIYGIHFDVASDRIQPQSETTIREIANVLQLHPAWRMRVEGYTDSDGGAAYNVGLSNRRANAVVKDLVAHYGVGRGRLKAAGFGLTHPVASNATDAGKALNRRVELVRL